MILAARGCLPPCHLRGWVSLGFASCTVMFSSSMGGDSPAQVGATLTSTSTGTGSSSGAIPATNFLRVDSSIPGNVLAGLKAILQACTFHASLFLANSPRSCGSPWKWTGQRTRRGLTVLVGGEQAPQPGVHLSGPLLQAAERVQQGAQSGPHSRGPGPPQFRPKQAEEGALTIRSDIVVGGQPGGGRIVQPGELGLAVLGILSSPAPRPPPRSLQFADLDAQPVDRPLLCDGLSLQVSPGMPAANPEQGNHPGPAQPSGPQCLDLLSGRVTLDDLQVLIGADAGQPKSPGQFVDPTRAVTGSLDQCQQLLTQIEMPAERADGVVQ